MRGKGKRREMEGLDRQGVERERKGRDEVGRRREWEMAIGGKGEREREWGDGEK